MGIVSHPTFTTSTGVVLQLKPIPPTLFDRFEVEYKKIHPKPVPPKREAIIGEEKILIHDTKDAWYMEQLEEWEYDYVRAQMRFTLSRGIANQVPKNWQPDPELYTEEMNESQRKAAWILEQLITNDDLIGLPEAITSLRKPTEKALEEAKKNLP